MKNRLIEELNDLTRWPKHIKDYIWWIGQGGLYKNISIGPYKSNSGHKPFDLRCNCCFVCSMFLRVFIWPIMKIIFRKDKFESSTFNIT